MEQPRVRRGIVWQMCSEQNDVETFYKFVQAFQRCGQSSAIVLLLVQPVAGVDDMSSSSIATCRRVIGDVAR